MNEDVSRGKARNPEILESCRIRQNLTESNGIRRLPQDSGIPCFSLGKFKAVLGNPRES